MRCIMAVAMAAAALVAMTPARGDAVISDLRYRSVLKNHIRHDQVFSFETFSADIIWGALLLTSGVREAIWERESWITERNAEIGSVLIPLTQVQGTQFIIGLYAPKGTDAFDLTSESFWALKLEQNGGEYTPLAIEPIPNDPLVKRLIPFTHHWAKLYRVTFAGEFQPPFRLRMVGATAKGTINWR